MNSAARALLSPDAPLNGRFFDLLSPQDASLLKATRTPRVGTAVSPLTTELVFEKRIPNQIEIAASPLPGNAIIFSIRDITEHRCIEQQLVSVQRLETLGLLAAGIAHDLNNILTAILGSASLLQLTAQDSDQAQVQTIVESSKRGGELLEQLLSCARGSDRAIEDIDLLAMTREVAQVASDSFPSNIEVVLATGTNHGSSILRGNATQLHQILMNLCVNARDVMLEGGQLTLHVARTSSAESRPDTSPPASIEKPHLTVSVTDSGSGIPLAIRPASSNRSLPRRRAAKALASASPLSLDW
ncbi:MAG: hypothetical protein J6386_21630 [Candidatus Synoicihabitans palmerolidicus]|nr:hypothetical protein [Candidatus Synoicihabitans palmerolidicus]